MSTTARPTWYVTSTRPSRALHTVSCLLADQLAAAGGRPVVVPGLSRMPGSADPDQAMAEVLGRIATVDAQYDNIVVQGSSFEDPLEFRPNARMAAHLGANVVLVNDHPVTAAQVDSAVAQAALEGARVVLAIAPTRVAGAQVPVVAWSHGDQLMPPMEHLTGPSLPLRAGSVVSSVSDALDEASAMRLLLVAERPDEVLLGLVIGGSLGRPMPAGVVLCGRRPSSKLVDLMAKRLPGVAVAHTTMGAGSLAACLSAVLGTNLPDLSAATSAPTSSAATTPLVFRQRLFERARAAGKHIVLPEGTDDRVLQAADALLREGICELTILGPSSVADRGRELGLDLSRAHFVDPEGDTLRDRFAAAYAELRKAKGVTPEQARERMLDVSYFGTMMVQQGLADGMVSGAAHTTAHTIRPSFEVIKTRKGVSVVSSVFFMCLANQVLVLGDCAVNPNPSPEQLADIAVSSAETARQFGIDPRVAMLSYSTLGSGNGPDVDRVVEATRIAREKAPSLSLDGPLQFDAAVAESVARSKAPDSPVAGRANVLIFPDLDAGNSAYKAVQRTAGALAVGPVLQGLNKPINDLSRGALVDDIINTVAITAIQAVTS